MSAPFHFDQVELAAKRIEQRAFMAGFVNGVAFCCGLFGGVAFFSWVIGRFVL